MKIQSTTLGNREIREILLKEGLGNQSCGSNTVRGRDKRKLKSHFVSCLKAKLKY